MNKKEKTPHQKKLDDLYKKVKKEDKDQTESPAHRQIPEESEPMDKGKRRAPYPISDFQILKKHHKFLRQEDEDEKPNYRPNNHEYGELLAKKYYTKLYKQFAIIDLEQYETGKIGCRWRTEKEVLSRKGEKTCSNKKCDKQSKQTYEFNFAYAQEGERKNALVKVRLCQLCVPKLNYKKTYVKIEEQ